MEIKVKARVGNDPELKFVTQEQIPLVTFNAAYTPRSRKGNEWVDGETMWFRVAMFGKKAEAIPDSLKKGDEVLIIGSVKQSTYQSKDGSDKTALEINAAEIALIPRLQKSPERSQAPQRGRGEWDAPAW